MYFHSRSRWGGSTRSNHITPVPGRLIRGSGTFPTPAAELNATQRVRCRERNCYFRLERSELRSRRQRTTLTGTGQVISARANLPGRWKGAGITYPKKSSLLGEIGKGNWKKGGGAYLALRTAANRCHWRVASAA